MSSVRQISTYTTITIALLSLLVAVLKVFGLLDWPFIVERIPAITLIVVSSLVVNFILDHRKHLDDLGNEMRKHLADIGRILGEVQVDRFNRLKENIDPEIYRLFGQLVEDAFTNVLSAATDQAISFTDMRVFPIYYIEVLREFNKGIFLAVSLATDRYLWRNTEIVEAFGEFIKAGGKMRRIFIVEDPKKLSEEERRNISTQTTLGVETFVLARKLIDIGDQQFFLVDQDCRIGWSATLDAVGAIIKVTATCGEESLRKRVRLFERLLKSALAYHGLEE